MVGASNRAPAAGEAAPADDSGDAASEPPGPSGDAPGDDAFDDEPAAPNHPVGPRPGGGRAWARARRVWVGWVSGSSGRLIV